MVLRLIRQLHRFMQSITPCPICLQSSDNDLCSHCQNALSPPPLLRCRQCGLAIGEAGLCGRCQGQAQHFDYSYCLADYRWPYDHLLKAYKYRHQPHLATCLANLFVQQHPFAPEQLPDALAFVPLHWFKYWQRGFNQSEDLAHWLGQHYQCPVGDYLQRPRYGKTQASLNAKQRRRALQSCFKLKNHSVPAHVALVDDVVTTASTANVLAQLLKLGGAKQVDLWFICRTP